MSGDDATESSQENELSTWPELLDKLFALRMAQPISNMSVRLLAIEA